MCLRIIVYKINKPISTYKIFHFCLQYWQRTIYATIVPNFFCFKITQIRLKQCAVSASNNRTNGGSTVVRASFQEF